MAAAAVSLLETLDEKQRAKLCLHYNSEERQNWGYVPRPRKGLSLDGLRAPQIEGIRALLRSALSDPGLKKVDTIMALEAFLWEMEDYRALRDPEAYFTSIFGKPDPNGSWGWRFEGHHISLNYTITEGKVTSVTPSFLGANPAVVVTEHSMKGTRPLGAEEDLARLLANFLNEAGHDVIFAERPPRDILTGDQRKFNMLKPVGVQAIHMTEGQKAALMNIIREFAHRHRKELAIAELQKVQTRFHELYFGWAGSLKVDEPFYYRIQCQTFLIEVANVQNGGNHIHTVWRDLESDFGGDLLQEHIRHEH